MSNVICFNPEPVLGPEDLRKAADAFEAALGLIPEDAHDLKPYTARQLLARFVIESALAGEREPIRLRDGALTLLARKAKNAT